MIIIKTRNLAWLTDSQLIINVFKQVFMATGNFDRYIWTSVWLGFGTLLGIIFVLWFSIENRLNTGLLLLWSIAYLAIGGLLGFIFSVPKMISENKAPLTNDNSRPTNALLTTKYQENTNLTQISDWLTKVLIGAGLVQLREFPIYLSYCLGNR